MLTAKIEQMPITRFHYKLLVIIGLGWMFDAMDTGLVAFILPAIASDWQLTPNQVGLIGSIGMAGMAIGAAVSGYMADRWGRKNVLAATLLIYSVSTGLCGFAWNYESLLFFRFLVGFGLGGELPVAATLMTEYSPARVRGRFIVLLESFWSVGWLVASIIAYMLIPVYGWHMAFFVGAIPAFYVFIIRLAIPESIRYLLAKGRKKEAQEIVAKIEKETGVNLKTETLNLKEEKEENISWRILWQGQYRNRTIMLWLVWFGIVFSYYGIFTWLPSIMVKQGHTLIKSFEYLIIITLAQFPGYFSAAWLVDKIGRKITLSVYLLLSGIAACFFGISSSSNEVMLWGCLISFFNLGAWGVLYTYTPELYPTAIRGCGSGWAAAVGRIGGIIAPISVGLIISNNLGNEYIFGLFAIVFIFIAFIVAILGPETKQRELNQINSLA